MSSPKRARMAGWLSGRGLEFGALHQPLTLPEDVVVEYVDRLSVAELRRQYPELEQLELVPVHHIGSVEQLDDVTDASVDFVIACHVLEHLEDPTRGLREIHRVLREGGLFYCALPEPRVTFDRHRALTSVEHLVRHHPAGSVSREQHFVDWIDNVERHQDWWTAEEPAPEERLHVLLEMDYSIHYHVWRPDTFLDYLSALRHQEKLVFELVDFAGCLPAVDDEFIFILRKGVAALPLTPPHPPVDAPPHPSPADPSPADLTLAVGGARQALREAGRAASGAAAAVIASVQRRLRRRIRR